MPPAPPDEVSPWLARVRHDLVKRLVWPASRRSRARARLGSHRAGEAPAGLDLEGFAAALARAAAAAAAGEIDGVLALEPAFDDLAARAQQLARSLNP